jgi:hypothetical protein
MVAPVRRAFMRLSAKILAAFDLRRFIDQNAQRFAGAVEALRQKGRVRCLQGIALNSLCIVVVPSSTQIDDARRNP